jgi:hypothetical protein
MARRQRPRAIRAQPQNGAPSAARHAYPTAFQSAAPARLASSAVAPSTDRSTDGATSSPPLVPERAVDVANEVARLLPVNRPTDLASSALRQEWREHRGSALPARASDVTGPPRSRAPIQNDPPGISTSRRPCPVDSILPSVLRRATSPDCRCANSHKCDRSRRSATVRAVLNASPAYCELRADRGDRPSQRLRASAPRPSALDRAREPARRAIPQPCSEIPDEAQPPTTNASRSATRDSRVPPAILRIVELHLLSALGERARPRISREFFAVILQARMRGIECEASAARPRRAPRARATRISRRSGYAGQSLSASSTSSSP